MTVKGTVVKVRYRSNNENNPWCVISIVGEDKKCKTLVGNMPGITVSLTIEADCEFKIHEKYGPQYEVSRYKIEYPKTVDGIYKILSNSDFVPGIGPVFARRIVNKFGTDTIEILNNNPDRLMEVDGIGTKRCNDIKRSWQETAGITEILSALASYGISASQAYRIYNIYGGKSVQILQENPYQIIGAVRGISFQFVDQIASATGMSEYSDIRICSGFIYVLEQSAKTEGHCYLKEWTLFGLSEKESVLNINDRNILAKGLERAVNNGELIRVGDNIYLPKYYRDEQIIVSKLHSCMAVQSPDIIPQFATSNIKYDSQQKKAIIGALSNQVFYITGGPGTGKTTIIKEIVQSALFSMGVSNSDMMTAEYYVRLAAPTGKAAKRLSLATGYNATTIHRLLEANLRQFKRHEHNPITGKMLIVDECSMIDIELMVALLNAVPAGMRVIFVGDANQLPSVGPGNVLRDIIDSKVIPGITLTETYRQGDDSNIPEKAADIIRGVVPNCDKTSDKGYFQYAAKQSDSETAEQITRLAVCKFKGDVQILVPQHKGSCGDRELNARLQQSLNPNCRKPNGIGEDGENIQVGYYTFYKGDKVMQIVNDYDMNVFNGDTGIVEEVDSERKEIVVSFDSSSGLREEHIYNCNQIREELILAYAITVHKSQGSEYDNVIIALLRGNTFVANKNLVYTAVTRAKENCIVISDRATFQQVIHKCGSERNTTLATRLREGYGLLDTNCI